MTPEGGLYWENIRPTKQEFKFDYPDRVLAFADANGIEMRGHTLVWYGAMPDWTKQIRGAAEAERELTNHIEHVVSRYRGKIKTWHVVNEPIDDSKGAVPPLRASGLIASRAQRRPHSTSASTNHIGATRLKKNASNIPE